MIAAIVKPGMQEYQQELDSFHLTLNNLRDIGERIYAEYREATPHDAANAAGTYAYLASVRNSRDILCPLGWLAHRDQNLEMIVEPYGTFAIIPSSGDKNTGLHDLNIPDPRTKNQKGSQTDKKVMQNSGQEWLFPDPKPSPLVHNNIPTWFLLYHIDNKKNEIRMELSLPINIDIYTLRVNEWAKRIILPPVGRDNAPIDPLKYYDTIPDFDIEIRRKNK